MGGDSSVAGLMDSYFNETRRQLLPPATFLHPGSNQSHLLWFLDSTACKHAEESSSIMTTVCLCSIFHHVPTIVTLQEEQSTKLLTSHFILLLSSLGDSCETVSKPTSSALPPPAAGSSCLPSSRKRVALIKGRRAQLEQFGCGQEDEMGGRGHINAIWNKHQHEPLLLFLGLSSLSEGRV